MLMNPVTPPILSSENAYISLRIPFGEGFVPILNKILTNIQKYTNLWIKLSTESLEKPQM